MAFFHQLRSNPNSLASIGGPHAGSPPLPRYPPSIALSVGWWPQKERLDLASLTEYSPTSATAQASVVSDANGRPGHKM